MQKKRFRPFGTFVCSALLLGALTVPAMAANDISVKVDDQPVAFTDVRPIARSNRTFVPFRAIFEQMGAEVEWDGTTQTVIATRNGREVRLQLGQTDVRITENGKTRILAADVAPFAENNRTFVPIRFASQALGACVDWVQDTQTVLIVDVEKLMDGQDGAYENMDDYLAFTHGDAVQTVDGDITFALNYQSAMGELPLHMTGTVSGSRDASASQLSGSAKTDIAALQAAIEKNEGKEVIDSEIESLLARLADTSYQAIVSREDGKLYLSSPLMTELGAAEGGWMSFPLSAVAGTPAASLMTDSDSFADVVAVLAQDVELKHAPDATVATVRAFLENAKSAYGDSAWKASGAEKTLSASGTSVHLYYSAAGAVERAQMSGTSTEGAVTYSTSVDQTADRYTLSLSRKKADTSDLSLTLTLDSSAGGAAPAARPTGDVTEYPFQ